jgi:hypothetical protein
MVEINIAVKTDEPAELQDILEHIVKEITDSDYRRKELSAGRKVDLNWVYLDKGRYSWSRNDRT